MTHICTFVSCEYMLEHVIVCLRAWCELLEDKHHIHAYIPTWCSDVKQALGVTNIRCLENFSLVLQVVDYMTCDMWSSHAWSPSPSHDPLNMTNHNTPPTRTTHTIVTTTTTTTNKTAWLILRVIYCQILHVYWYLLLAGKWWITLPHTKSS